MDSEEERFKKWQQERESKLNAVNYVKDDKIYVEPTTESTKQEKGSEKRRLKHFLSNYKKDRLKKSSSNRNFHSRPHLSEVNKSLTEMGYSDKKSEIESETKGSKKNAMNPEIEDKNSTNFFDIFMAISKPIVDNKKSQKKLKRRMKRKARAHSNAFSVPN